MDQFYFASEPLTLHRAVDITLMAVALVFGYAAASKLLDVPKIAAGIRSYAVIPDRMAPLAVGILIVSEVLIAVAHFAEIGLRFAMPATIALLSIFFVASANLVRRHEKRPCLCFGANRDDEVDFSSLARISILWLAEVSAYLFLTVSDAPMSASMGTRFSAIESMLPAALVITVAGWGLSLPKFHRAWRNVMA